MSSLKPALSNWHSQYSYSAGRRKKPPEKDFITLNCLAAQSGLTTSHEQSQFRACHDIRKRDKEGERRQSQSQRLPEDIAYGISTR